MSENEAGKGAAGRAEEFLQIFQKGAQFTQDLLKENERLRYQLLELEKKCRASAPVEGGFQAEAQKYERRIQALESEKQEILNRIKQVEAENLDFANRYVDVETQNNMLANLYIASYQLHSTLDSREVLQVITEIVINLIGAEEFVIMLLDEKTRVLHAVAAEGTDVASLPQVPVGEGVVGQVADSGENYFVEDLEGYDADFSRPLVCIPLKIKEHVIGVINIYKLLEQKSRFADVDYELFTLLAGHAATAIYSSKLYSESERKLSTIQGFIDLLSR